MVVCVGRIDNGAGAYLTSVYGIVMITPRSKHVDVEGTRLRK